MDIDNNQILAAKEEDTQQDLYLMFALDNENFGMEISYVESIVAMQAITPMPEVPSYIKGVINLRGKIIPVVDMRLKFKKIPAAYNDRTCIVILVMKDITVGLIVDEVNEVVRIGEKEIVPPPDSQLTGSHKYIKGIGKADGAVKLLIDCEKLFGSDGEADFSKA